MSTSSPTSVGKPRVSHGLIVFKTDSGKSLMVRAAHVSAVEYYSEFAGQTPRHGCLVHCASQMFAVAHSAADVMDAVLEATIHVA